LATQPPIHIRPALQTSLSLSHALGFAALAVGAWKYLCTHLLAGVFQMAYSLEQAKSKKWTRRMNLLSNLVSWTHSVGACIAIIGCHFAHDQKGTDMAVGAGFICIGMIFIFASACI
jgi:hypothetical protein